MRKSFSGTRFDYPYRTFGSPRMRARRNITNAFFFITALVFAGAFVVVGLYFNMLFAFIFLFLSLSMFFAFFKGEYLLFIIAVVFSFPIPINIGPIHITPMDLIFGMIFLSVLYRAAVFKKFDYPSGLYLIAGTLIVTSVVLSSLMAVNMFSALPEIIQFTYFALVIPFVVMNLTSGPRQITSVLKLMAALFVMQAVLVIAQFFLILNGNTVIRDMFPYANPGGESGEFFRSYGSIGPAVGIFMAVGVCVMLMMLLRQRSNIVEKAGSVMGILLCVYANSCAGMRSGIGVIAFVIPTFALFMRRYILSFVLIMAVAVGALMVITVGKDMYPFKLYYGHGGFRDTDLTDAMNRFKEEPLLGLGPQQFERERIPGRPTGAENEMVRRLVEGGVIGGAAFIIWCAVPLLLAARVAFLARSDLLRNLGTTLFFAFLIFVIHGFAVSDLFEGGHGHLMLFLIGFILALDREFNTERKTPDAVPATPEATPAPRPMLKTHSDRNS